MLSNWNKLVINLKVDDVEATSQDRINDPMIFERGPFKHK